MLASCKAVPEESSCFICEHFKLAGLFSRLLQAIVQEGLGLLCEVMGREDVVGMLVSCESVLDLGEDTVNTE